MVWDDFIIQLNQMGPYVTAKNPYQLDSLNEQEQNTVITVNNRAAIRQAIINGVRKYKKIFYERSQWSLKKIPNVNDVREIEKDKMEYDWDYTMIAIHHAGEGAVCSTGFNNIRKAESTHMDGHKWSDIGYHYAIDCSGNIYEARDIRLKGSHLSRYNTGAIGIVLLERLSETGENGFLYALSDTTGYSYLKTGREVDGEITHDMLGPIFPPVHPKIPELQLETLQSFIEILTEYFHIDTLGGHREFPYQDRSCPGNVGIKIVEKLRDHFGFKKPIKS